MKKIAIMAVVVMLSFSIAACATKSSEAKTRVKCPACGYEFEVPGSGR